MDIAPLGFAVDTAALATAGTVAQETAAKITSVAAAADAVGASTAASSAKVAAATQVHKDHAKAVTDAAAAHDTLKQKVVSNSDTIVSSANAELAARQRIHDMIDKSLAQYDVQAQKIQAAASMAATLIPKNAPALAFQHSVEAKTLAAMGPTEADITRQQKATAAAAAFNAEMIKLTAAVDPQQAKLLRLNNVVEQLGKQFDAGKISQAEYNAFLSKVDQQETMILSQPAQQFGRRHRHNTFLGEAGRSFTYGIPRFGREARRLVYSAESEESGGTLGQGLMGFAPLIGGAVAGMAIAEVFRMLIKLPEEMAKAVDEAEKLERQLDAIGSSGGLQNARDLADQLHISIKGAADEMIKFQGAVQLLPAANGPNGQNAFTAAIFAGRVGGLDEKQSGASADALAKMANKPVVTGSDILSMMQSNPTLANAIGGQLGVGDAKGLASLASTGQLTGERLLQAAAATNTSLKIQSNKIAENAEEVGTRASNAWDKVMARTGDGLLAAIRKHVEIPLYNWLSGDHPTSGVTAKLPPTQAELAKQLSARALTDTEGVGNQHSRAEIIAKLGEVANALKGATGTDRSNLQQRQASLQLQLSETPFGMIAQQVGDITAAFGHGEGSSGLIGVWEHALQIQREQVKQANGVSDSLQQIVDKLLEVKRGMQAIADQDELKKLADSIATQDAEAANPGSFAAKLAAQEIKMRRFYSDRAEYDSSGSSSSGTAITPTGRGGFNQYGEAALARFTDRFGAEVAKGIAAGITAEGGSLGMAANGAFGIGQWRGNRQRNLFRRYGNHPTLGNQLDYLDQELSGGDAGGHSVLSAGTATAALEAYIRNFMRPGGGTQGDLNRGDGALGAKGSAAASTSGVPDQRDKVGAEMWAQFFGAAKQEAANKLGPLVGYDNPLDFLKTGKPGWGGSIMNASIMAGNIDHGAKLGVQQRLETELKIQEAVRGLPPLYAAAAMQAMRLNDAAQTHLKTEQEIFKLTEQAEDNQKRAAALATGRGDIVRMQDLMLQLKDISESKNSPEDIARQQGAAIKDAQSKSSIDVSKIIGDIAKQTQSLKDRQYLEQFSTGSKGGYDEQSVEAQILKMREEMRDASLLLNQADRDRLALEEQEQEQILRANAQLKQQLDTVDAIKASYKFATDTIGTAWSNMFVKMEETGKVRTQILLRGIEDGFYGMVDRLYQKLVISPLMGMIDKLINMGLNSLFGNSAWNFGAGGGYDSENADLAGGLALGGVFGPRGLVPYARGGLFNAPTRFAYGGGLQGMAGEGPGIYEAIMPLTRRPDGKLGVASSGGGSGGDVMVTVNDYRGTGAAPAEITHRQIGDGKRALDITLRDATRGNVSSGRLDGEMASTYGLSRPPVSR